MVVKTCEDALLDDDLQEIYSSDAILLTEHEAAMRSEPHLIKKKPLFVVVDVEATGPCPGLYSMHQIGAVCLQNDLSNTYTADLRLDGTLDSETPPPRSDGNFRRTFRDPAEVIGEFATWLGTMKGEDKYLVFWSDNNGFDWQFVNYYFHRYLGSNPFGHSSSNINSYYKSAEGWSKSFKHLRETHHSHQAVEDAKGNAEALIKIIRQRDPSLYALLGLNEMGFNASGHPEPTSELLSGDPASDLYAPPTEGREGKIAYKLIKTFQNEIGLTYQDLTSILGGNLEIWSLWERDKSIPIHDKLFREAFSNLTAIYKSLCRMFGHKDDREQWLRTPHPDFGQRSPLSIVMKDFRGVIQVRDYLDVSV